MERFKERRSAIAFHSSLSAHSRSRIIRLAEITCCLGANPPLEHAAVIYWRALCGVFLPPLVALLLHKFWRSLTSSVAPRRLLVVVSLPPPVRFFSSCRSDVSGATYDIHCQFMEMSSNLDLDVTVVTCVELTGPMNCL